jgi:uncharacterized protein (TIGR02466 family)
MTIQMTAREMIMLFPTPLFTGKLSDTTACDRIEQKLREIQRSAGQSNAPAYMTPDNIHTLPEMKELVNVVMEESGRILDVYQIKRDSHYIASMWANINEPNHPHFIHVHPNCLFSGILYIKTPKDCGPTVFSSPRQLTRMIEPAVTAKNELNSDVFRMPAEKGRMVIWPSYLPHGVQGGHSKELSDRIIVAFNIMIRGRIELETMRLTLS